MKIVWVLLQTTRELNSIYVFRATDSVVGNGPAKMKKIRFCLLTSEGDCLRKNFNNAPHMFLFDVIQKFNR